MPDHSSLGYRMVMSPSRRFIASASVLLTATLLLAGCASSPNSAEPGSSGSGTPGDSGSGAPAVDDLDLDAAWLDNGRAVALVTQGSSTCIPTAAEVEANGQTVTVQLDEGDPAQACTADLTARASIVSLPEGVDPTKDVELLVTLGELTGDTGLDGNAKLTGVPGEPTDYLPSAGWFDDDGLVLLTWGSSTCLPIVDSIEASGSAATITFVTEDRPCTMDMVPRATVIEFGELAEDADDADDAGVPFALTLVGDNLDASIEVLEG